MPVQYEAGKTYTDGSIQTAKGHFVAEDIPSIGYKTFYIRTLQKHIKVKTKPSYENDFYKIPIEKNIVKINNGHHSIETIKLITKPTF